MDIRVYDVRSDTLPGKQPSISADPAATTGASMCHRMQNQWSGLSKFSTQILKLSFIRQLATTLFFFGKLLVNISKDNTETDSLSVPMAKGIS